MAATRTLSAEIPDREIALAAFKLGMLDCTVAEIGRAILLCELEGLTPDQAKARILDQRTTPGYGEGTGIFSMRVPTAWVDQAREKEPHLTLSQFFRYACHKLTEPAETARERAIYQRGRPRKEAAA